MAAEEKKRKRRAYSRAYLKEYRKKHRLEIRRVIEGAKEADREKRIAEAEVSADGLLHTDGTEQVAAIVAGENKIVVESSLPTKEEARAKYVSSFMEWEKTHLLVLFSAAIVGATVKACGCALDFAVWNSPPVPACPRCAPAVVYFSATVRTIELSGQHTRLSVCVSPAHGLP